MEPAAGSGVEGWEAGDAEIRIGVKTGEYMVVIRA
jgi:hypothetical protein